MLKHTSKRRSVVTALSLFVKRNEDNTVTTPRSSSIVEEHRSSAEDATAIKRHSSSLVSSPAIAATTEETSKKEKKEAISPHSTLPNTPGSSPRTDKSNKKKKKLQEEGKKSSSSSQIRNLKNREAKEKIKKLTAENERLKQELAISCDTNNFLRDQILQTVQQFAQSKRKTSLSSLPSVNTSSSIQQLMDTPVSQSSLALLQRLKVELNQSFDEMINVRKISSISFSLFKIAN